MHVNALAGMESHETKEALLGLCMLLAELGGRLEVTSSFPLVRPGPHGWMISERAQDDRPHVPDVVEPANLLLCLT